MALVVSSERQVISTSASNDWEVNEFGGLVTMIDSAVTGEFAPGKWDYVIAIDDDDLEDFLSGTGA